METAADTHRALWRLLTAFRASRAVGVLVELGIPELLAAGPKSATELAAATGAHAQSLRRMLLLLVAFDVVAEDDAGRFSLSDLGEETLENRLGPLVRFLMSEPEWATWGRLDHSIMTGERAFDFVYGMRTWEYYSQHPAAAAIFDAAMQSLTRPVAEAVASAYDFSTLNTLVDVGGGDGTMLIGILQHHAHLRGVLFDRPHVVERARSGFEHAGLASRVELVGGSFFDSIPAGADAYLMKSIVHDWEADKAIAILERCREATNATGARLLVVERLLSERIGPDDADALLSDLNMLVLPGGRERTAGEYAELFERAGFRLQRTMGVGPQFHLLEATPA